MFQYGNENVANQTITSTDIESIKAILTQLHAGLLSVDPTSRGELQEVAHDLQQEIQKRRPSAMALIQGATAITTLAEKLPALKPVYNLAADYLRAHGVPVP